MILASVGITPAWAERGDQYVLGKLGFMSVDLNNADPLFSVGILYGYGLTSEITLESELNLGLLGGEYEQKNSLGEVFEEGEYRIWTLAGYGVYRFPLSNFAYLKGKLGVLYENVKRSGKIDDKTSTGFGLAGGLGAGTQVIENLTVEAEITGIDKDIIFYSLGLHYVF
jgi:opacity protein-like surface antigen